MPITTVIESPRAMGSHGDRPETFRLPKVTERDPFFGFTRTFYYEGEARGYWKLIRICERGKTRGLTLVPFAAVARFVHAYGKGAA